jgi:hypothetical protein
VIHPGSFTWRSVERYHLASNPSNRRPWTTSSCEVGLRGAEAFRSDRISYVAVCGRVKRRDRRPERTGSWRTHRWYLVGFDGPR